jgi:hypothetical protein
MVMELHPEIVDEIRRRIEEARQRFPSRLSDDGKAIRVYGGMSYDCWISPDGDIYAETYDPLCEDSPVADRSRDAQLMVLSLGARTFPQLLWLLPVRPATAVDCSACRGGGWFWVGEMDFICHDCCGLGWREDTGHQS